MGIPMERNKKRERSQEHGGLLHHSKRVGEDGGKKESLRIETAPEIFSPYEDYMLTECVKQIIAEVFIIPYIIM